MVFDFLKGRAAEAPEQKASATGPVISYHSSGRVAWSARDTVSLTKVGFSGNPVGFRSVKLIAEAAAALPLVVQDKDVRFDEHPLLKLISRPNQAQARAELFEALYGQILLSGDGYLEAVVGPDDAPAELHVLRSDRMSIVPGADGWPVAYEPTFPKWPAAWRQDRLIVPVEQAFSAQSGVCGRANAWSSADRAVNPQHPGLAAPFSSAAGGPVLRLSFSLGPDRSHAHSGGARNRWIAARMVRTIGPVTATSASWKVMARAWRMTRAPILISLSCRLVSDHWAISSGNSMQRRMVARL